MTASSYGPLPAPAEAEESNQPSAVSVVDASCGVGTAVRLHELRVDDPRRRVGEDREQLRVRVRSI